MIGERILAAEGTEVQIGHHIEFQALGMTFNLDTILGTLFAAGIVVGLGLFVRAKVTAGVPNGTQLFFESVISFLRNQVETSIGVRTAPFLVPLSVALFVFILACNWIVILPLHHYLPPPTADVNLVYPMALMVFFWRQVSGSRQHGGAGRQFLHIAKGHQPALAPMWLLEEITSFVSHALRLFGNLFAGGVMLALFGLIPAWIAWAPTTAWKLFDMFIGLIQAFIFAFLTIIYFAQSMEDREAHH
ncbi:MAG TPA: F0F1 ATP synthase subunit A [Actinophytocola sp.]|uniref:F0F1 ATP synthase subunit A n=1 Tax=Actinophytocola sp. TaxID=1872138 RepID=UPI002DB66C6C|nr:F0F1 ATP synthase subunit A [Actinophytocola sp.]HEU5470019.1 F0F1 ATP synthase subunit A [Actinophytocola sp.]